MRHTSCVWTSRVWRCFELVVLDLSEGDASGRLGTRAKRQRSGSVIVLAAVAVLFKQQRGLWLRKEEKKQKWTETIWHVTTAVSRKVNGKRQRVVGRLEASRKVHQGCGNRLSEIGQLAERSTGDNRSSVENNFRYSSVKNNLSSNTI